MREELLHRFWNPKCTNRWDFKTMDLKSIIIRNFGELNTLQGPDFKEAEVEVNGLVFYGSIELHIKSSHWNKHGHQYDCRYNQVVLHVVWEYDESVMNQLGQIVPTICLSDYFLEKDLQKAQPLTKTVTKFPCNLSLNQLDTNLIEAQLNAASIGEMRIQSEETFNWAEQLNFDWERVLFIRLFAYSVDPQNRQIAYDLAKQIPVKYFKRFQKFDYIGWVISESGLWDQSPQFIRNHFQKYIHSYKRNIFPKIEPLQNWQNRNLRPGAYPIQRIMQFLEWIDAREGYIDDLIDEKNIENLHRLLCEDRGLMNSDPKKKVDLERSNSNLMGNTQIRERLIQNAILPVWGARRIYLGNEIDFDFSKMLKKGSFESNRITESMNWLINMGAPKNQKMSHALLAQHKHFCGIKKCSSCRIGQELWG